MKVILRSFLFFLCLLGGCTEVRENKTSSNDISIDSTNQYYQLSRNKDLSKEERLKNINKALLNVSDKTSDTLYLKYKSQQSTLYGLLKDYDSAILSASELLTQARYIGDLEYEAKAYRKLGRYYYKLEDYVTSYRNYKISYDRYKAIDNEEGMYFALNTMAEIEKNKSLYKLAGSSAIEALEYLSPDDRRRAILYKLLSNTERERGIYKEAIVWADSALALNEKFKENKYHKLHRTSFLNTKALALRENGAYKDASDIFKNLINTTTAHVNPIVKARYLSNYAYSLWRTDTTLNVEEPLLEALSLREKKKDSIGLVASYSHLTDYFEYKDVKKFKQYAEKFYMVSKNVGASIEEIEALTKLKRHESNNETIYRYTEMILDAKEKRDKDQKEVEDTFSAIRYSGELKDEKIGRLVSYTKLQEQVIQNERLLKMLILGFGVFLLLFILYRSKQRQKKARLDERLLAEARFSKKIHDEIANDVYNVMSQLQIQNSSVNTLDKLDDIYQKTRDISKESSPLNTEVDFLQTITAMLSSYVPRETKLVIRGLDGISWESISSEKKTELYRVLQELMTNMKKHSEATLVVLAFAKAKKILEVTYSDNGVGLPEGLAKGNGLVNVESRISSLKGTLTFGSTNGNGFEVTMKIPA